MSQAPELDPILSEHETKLASLRADYETLSKLRAKSAELDREIGNATHWIEMSAERLLAGEREPELEGESEPELEGESEPELEGESEPELEGEIVEWDSKVVSLKAQVLVNSRNERSAEEGLQGRLLADITATERLYGYWISYLEDREAAKLLESVEPAQAGKVEVVEAARTLAIAGKTYCQTIGELGSGAPISYAWQRALDPLPSEKSLASQTLLAHDPMFGAPKRAETVAALLGAAEKQVTRWSALLGQVKPAVSDGTFVMPSYLEPEKVSALPQWNGNEDLDQRSWRERYLASINRSWESLTLEQQAIILNIEANDQSYKYEPVVAEGMVVEGS